MLKKNLAILLGITALTVLSCKNEINVIPLPEHPRPDFERADFINLNGYWNFTFDETKSIASIDSFDKKILVPFPWGSKLSEVKDEGNIGWYGRTVNVPKSWKGKRVFVVVGASDWKTGASLNGKQLGTHCGGYTPFEFEITDMMTPGGTDTLKIMADDEWRRENLKGKQGYGNARGIWQTVYLEARGEAFIKSLHFSPDIDNEKVLVDALVEGETPQGARLSIKFKNREYGNAGAAIVDGKASFEIAMPGQHLWELDDPYLYEITASVESEGRTIDKIDSYFGQRKVSAMKVPGQTYKYVALNNRPIYLKLCLDQSYHPDGFYTFPSDEFMKNEILLSKKFGLNGNRVHIKVEIPRKLYWADKLGLLIMADVPQFTEPPVEAARNDWEHCMRNQVDRDFNHPSIFAWVDFNETWGLFDCSDKEKKKYLPEVQEWVRSMYHLTKSLDPTRLVEDNSPCRLDHVETDLNSWHSYKAAYRWENTIATFDTRTVPGDDFNYIGGNVQGDEPMFNSECGNVWGYDGSAGDSDYTWDYHEMMNAFHRHPKVGGWLYTEHHDVINEWNGYVRYDRSPKFTGLDGFVPGMDIDDLNSDYYITTDKYICEEVKAGDKPLVKLMSSFTTDRNPGELTLETSLSGWNCFGEYTKYSNEETKVDFKAFCLSQIKESTLDIPAENGLYCYAYILKDAEGDTLSRNFSLFTVKDAPYSANAVTFPPSSYTAKEWSIKSTEVLGGLKVNGFGEGYFEYEVMIPEGVDDTGAKLIFEAGAKQLFLKDIEEGDIIEDTDFFTGKASNNPCRSSNAYSMSDTRMWPSKLIVTINGNEIATLSLEDDPADHRGALSWSSQPREYWMYEAGSYGYLFNLDIPQGILEAGKKATIRFTVPEVGNGGGLAIYGKDFGRYPLDPTIRF